MNTYQISHSLLAHLLEVEPNFPYTTDKTGAILYKKIMDLAKKKEWSKSFFEENFKAGEAVFLEGEWGDRMYLILSGRIAIIKGDLDSPTILAYRSEGEMIGEMALLENQPRSASVIALDRLHLLSVNRHKFQEMLHKLPFVSLSIMEMLSSRLRKTDEALTTGDQSEKHLIKQVSVLKNEKQRLEELRRLQLETSELIIHDLRNPISNITVSLDMLSKTMLEDTAPTNTKILEIAKSNCERMQRLVDTLLEVSRIESGESQFFITNVNFNQLLHETIKQFSTFEKKHIEILLSIQPTLPPIPADRDKLERVMVNLIDNAIKYSPPNGTIKIEVRMVGDELFTSITDQGPGVPEDQRERIFERFTQVSGESRKHRGFGLGLAYCRLAIEGHCGKIWVEAGEEGSGSCFTFTLPTFPCPVE